MNDLEAYAKSELEYDFYGYTVKEVVTEVKCCLEEIVNAALEDSKKKLINKFGSENEAEFEVVKTNYLKAIENNKDEMEELINDAFKLPSYADSSSCEPVMDEPSVDKEISDLQMRSAALDIYMKELMKTEVELKSVAELDISELQTKYDYLDLKITELSDNFHLANELFSRSDQNNHLEQSFGNMSLG